MKRMIKASTIVYPNGRPVSDVDLDKALSYMYGEDRDMDNSKYTDAEKQGAINYWIEKTDGPEPMMASSYGKDMSFNEYLDWSRYPGFAEAASGLTDEEFYELEDEYREWQKDERPVNGCGINASEYDNLDDDYSPFAGESYYVVIGDDHLVTSNPAKAIELWFKGEKKYPMDCAIVAKSKLDGINLLEAAKDVIQQMYQKYGSPYKLDYLVDMILKKLDDNLKFFHESEYGDQVDPFSYG